jgi:succinate dehydrogenase/fumarate reductase cytochrome b subunit
MFYIYMPLFCVWVIIGFLANFESLSKTPECLFENKKSWISIIIFCISAAIVVTYIIGILAFIIEYVSIVEKNI